MRPLSKFAVYAAALIVVALGCLFWVGGRNQTSQVDEIINAPPDVVYKHLTEPELVKTWVDGIVSIEPLTDEGHQVGAQAKIVVEHEGKKVELTDEVLVADENSHLIVVSNASMFKNNADYSMESPDQKTTKLRLINKVQFKGFYRFMGPFMPSAESKLKEDIHRLKLAAEKYFEENPTMAKKQFLENAKSKDNPEKGKSPDSK